MTVNLTADLRFYEWAERAPVGAAVFEMHEGRWFTIADDHAPIPCEQPKRADVWYRLDKTRL